MNTKEHCARSVIYNLDRVESALQSARLEGFRDRPCLQPERDCPETPDQTQTPGPGPAQVSRNVREIDWPERLARAFSGGFCAGPAAALHQRPLDALLTDYQPADPLTGAVPRASNLVSSFSLLVRSSHT